MEAIIGAWARYWGRGRRGAVEAEVQERGSVSLEGFVSGIMTQEESQQLRHCLPSRLKFDECVLSYGLKRDGSSLKTLLRQTKNKGASILLLKPNDAHADVTCIGAFLSESIQYHHMYYGSPDTFVFHIVDQQLHTYHWSGLNPYFVLCNDKGIGVGGGSHFAIHIDPDLYQCSSGSCDTFNSPPLVHHRHQLFPCSDLEVWTFE